MLAVESIRTKIIQIINLKFFFRTGRIGLHENDNAAEVAKNFAKAF